MRVNMFYRYYNVIIKNSRDTEDKTMKLSGVSCAKILIELFKDINANRTV